MEITNATHRIFEEHDLHKVADGIKTNVRGQNFIDVEIVMKPPDQHDTTAAEVIRLWRDEIGDIEGVDQITFEAERGPGGWQQDISSISAIPTFRCWRKRAKHFSNASGALRKLVSDNYNKGKAQFDLILRPEGRNLGLTSSGVGQQVRDAFYGALAMRQLRGTNEIEVRVKLPEVEREDIYFFENLVVRAPDGTEVPLLDVVAVDRSEALTSINRRDGRRVVTVGMDVEPARATTRVLEALQNEVLPQLRADFPGVTWSFEGSQAEMRESTRALWGGFACILALVPCLYMILVDIVPAVVKQ